MIGADLCEAHLADARLDEALLFGAVTDHDTQLPQLSSARTGGFYEFTMAQELLAAQPSALPPQAAQAGSPPPVAPTTTR